MSNARVGRGEAGEMVVAGVMSGTSADGIDVAICRVGPGNGGVPRWEMVGHRAFPFPKLVREAVLGAMNAPAAAVADLARLSWRLGALYADAVEKAQEELGVTVELVGCHGQTVYHQGHAERFLGAPVRATWQMGEAAVIAERLRCPVVSDLRPADLAAGGQGAPLVPMFDWVVLRDAAMHRVLLNLGGIANVTALRSGAGLEETLAFDTGPGNMVIDGCMRELYGKAIDTGGRVASRGRVFAGEVMTAMRDGYFGRLPPKSCGREQFGTKYVQTFIERCRKAGANNADIVTTATALTSSSVVEAFENFVLPHFPADAERDGRIEFLVSGGGAKNLALMGMLEGVLEERRVRVRRLEELGIDPAAKEAAAFALLGWMTWAGLPGNVVSATGATRPVVLGKICFG